MQSNSMSDRPRPIEEMKASSNLADEAHGLPSIIGAHQRICEA